MKLKKILLSFLLLLCLDQLLWKFVWNDNRTIFSSVTTSLFISLFWLIPIKTKKELDEQFLRESGLSLSPNEKMLLGSTANQINGTEVTGGKLFLTDQRLVFIDNKSKNKREFLRSEISSVQRHPEFPKALVVVTNDNACEFNVDKHSEWVRELITS